MTAEEIRFNVADSEFGYAKIDSSLRLIHHAYAPGATSPVETAEVLPLCTYGEFHEGIASVLDNVLDGYGYINSRGLFITPMRYIAADDFSEGRAFVTDDASTKLLDTAGSVIKDFKTILITGTFSEGIAIVSKVMSDTAGAYKRDAYVDRKGKIIIDFGDPDEITSPEIISGDDACSGGLIRVHTPAAMGRRFGFMDVHQKLRIPFMYEGAGKFSEGMAAAARGGKYGYITAQNRMVIACQFDEACAFCEGMAAVRVGDAWGYIDATGKIAIAPSFEKADAFENGSARVKVDGCYGIIDTRGAYIVQPAFDAITNFHHGICRILRNGKHGVMDRNGVMLFED